MIVPTLCVGTPPWTLCVRSGDAERHWMHSHAERGNDHHHNCGVS
ncbi:rplA family protein [Pseudomonas gessardii]|nr:rplA family protein [Pseudomonas gessardii]